MLCTWCEYTDLYAEYHRARGSYKDTWTKPSVQEMRTFLAILIATNYGLTPGRMEMLWSKKSDHWFFHTPGFWQVLTEKRYRDIKRYFQVTPPALDAPVSRDILRKVRTFLTKIQEKFSREFIPGEYITIDECMIPFKGRWRGKIYIRGKPVKWIKVDIMADCRTGYNCIFRVYSGKVQVPAEFKHLGVLAYLVAQLVASIEHKGYKLTLDRGYSSPYLFEYLALKGIGAVGTVQPNRKGFPQQLIKKPSETSRGEWDWYRSKNLLAVRWCDRNPIYFLSNYHYPDHRQVSRKDKHGHSTLYDSTSTVVDYNQFMNGVDRLDQNTIVDKRRKHYKWYFRVIVKVVEWCIFNAFTLMNEDTRTNGATREHHRKYDLEFRMRLCIQLIGDYRPPNKRMRLSAPAPPLLRLDITHPHTPVVGKGRDHTCTVCYEKHKIYKKKFPGIHYKDNPQKAVKTSFMCTTCNAYLCIKKDSTCWADYHGKKEFWRPMPWEKTASVQQDQEILPGKCAETA